MNSTLIEKLENYGCSDMQNTMERFLGDLDFYKMVLDQLIFDPSFDDLKEKLGKVSAAEAFDAAHTLKGIIANCGITPMYETVVQIVEPLRKGQAQGLMPLCEKLFAQKDALATVLSDLSGGGKANG